MKEQSFFFLCGEQAVKVYHRLSCIEDMTDEQLGDLVDYGSLQSLSVIDETTAEDLISGVIEIHEGCFDITLITENEYNYLQEKGLL